MLSWWNQTQTQGQAAHRIQQKLQIVNRNLKIWKEEVFNSSLTQQKATLQQIDRLDQKESDSRLSKEELLLQIRIKRELLDIAYQEEISWQQVSTLHWLKHGENNTSFFHKAANGRKARNFISSLNIDGSIVEDLGQIVIEKELFLHSKQYTKKSSF